MKSVSEQSFYKQQKIFLLYLYSFSLNKAYFMQNFPNLVIRNDYTKTKEKRRFALLKIKKNVFP